ncbi:DNA repair-scaffolding protein isoform X2 [Amia ocellicauda]|uniref:DNA repair-scaffolding protein isoform X2 n=1 Tax=Amia ocellicauda TaxID=2972642 RepID=UPI003463B485
MSLFTKRKRKSKDVRCIFFPDDASDGFKKVASEAKKMPSSVTKSWQRWGEGFQDCLDLEKSGSSGKTVRQLVPSLLSVAVKSSEKNESEDLACIVWSSSDSDSSEGENLHLKPPKTLTKGRYGPRRPAVINSYNRYLHMVNTTVNSEEDNLHDIDWDTTSEQDEDSRVDLENVAVISDSDCDSISGEQPVSVVLKGQTQLNWVADAEISEFSSDGESVVSRSQASTAQPQSQPCQASGRSASDWVRSAQALLQTPHKQADRKFKTPEDSAKKKNKFLRGGLAERLSRLQCRQRSAISFWRHQSPSASKTPAVCKAGVLVLQVLQVWEEGSVQVALCQLFEQPSPDGSARSPFPSAEARLQVLFSRDTATHLVPRPTDIVHVYPPWQKLIIDGERNPFILNTHFSQKVILEEKDKPGPKQKFVPEKYRPYSLVRVFNLMENKPQMNGKDLPPREVPPLASKPLSSQKPWGLCGQEVCDSLLEVIEGQGAVGCLAMDVIVIVQRVYILPFKELSSQHLLKNRSCLKAHTMEHQQHRAKLCLLVQDVYGMFSEVQLHTFHSIEDTLQQYSRKWEGKPCILKCMRVVQRTTRGRSIWLFNLIDSLWPPLVPLKVLGKSQESPGDSGSLPAPSFSYVLSAQRDEGTVEELKEEALQALYLPPVVHTLQEILQCVPDNHRCSFTATITYKRVQSVEPGQGEFWLFVTDSSLQSEEDNRLNCCRTVPVRVTTSCVLGSAVMQALKSASSCSLAFKDVVKERDTVLCVERTVLEPQLCVLSADSTVSPGRLPELVKLDELDPKTKANTLCVVKGVVVGVDESKAYSWPVCCWCGNENLDASNMEQQRFFCSLCVTTVDRPTMKMQLEVFLHCDSYSQCTVKVKLQQKTIESLLKSAASGNEGYEVENVLGKAVGPLTGYVHVVTREPAAWIGLEEITL